MIILRILVILRLKIVVDFSLVCDFCVAVGAQYLAFLDFFPYGVVSVV